MASPSKEDVVLELILEHSPLKEWHFDEIVQEAKVSRLVANKWLSKYVSSGLLKHLKVKGRFPHFTAGKDNPVYLSMKRIFALKKIHESGLFAHLISMKSAKSVIIFGSMARGDWYKDSDIDIFVLGDVEEFDKTTYEDKLRKNIELHVFRDRSEIDEVKSGLLKNIVNGYVLKGRIQDFAEVT
jgi:predicted nucleotidyltransferase